MAWWAVSRWSHHLSGDGTQGHVRCLGVQHPAVGLDVSHSACRTVGRRMMPVRRGERMGKHGGDTTTKPRALAERTGSTGDQYTVTRAGRHGEPALFGLRMGRNVTDAQLAKLGGAQPDASVRLFGASDHKSLFLDIHGANNAYYATREVIRDAQGLLTIRNHNLEVHASGRVLGTRILATQVKQASRFNVARLETKAARNDTRIPPTTGYRAWPRVGYEATSPAPMHSQR